MELGQLFLITNKIKNHYGYTYLVKIGWFTTLNRTKLNSYLPDTACELTVAIQ